MAERLGNVLYWAATAVAIPLLLLGGLMCYYNYLHGALYYYTTAWPTFLAGVAIWLLGRACRYVLAGR
jgi:hypothetical protein